MCHCTSIRAIPFKLLLAKAVWMTCLAVSTRGFLAKDENLETFAIFLDNGEEGV